MLPNNLSSLQDEIFNAAQLLKQEENLSGDLNAIASVISHSLEDYLDNILWNYRQNSPLQKSISQLELTQELTSIN